MLNLTGKKAIVEKEAAIVANALSLVAADYRRLTVAQLTELRVKARASGVYVRVVRNNLMKRAVKNTAFECIADTKELAGPNLFVFSMEAPGAGARLLKEFSKENENLKVKFLSMDGKILPASDLSAMASLPTRDEALAQLMRVMKAPVEKLARTLIAPHIKLVRTIAAVAEQKQAH